MSQGVREFESHTLRQVKIQRSQQVAGKSPDNAGFSMWLSWHLCGAIFPCSEITASAGGDAIGEPAAELVLPSSWQPADVLRRMSDQATEVTTHFAVPFQRCACSFAERQEQPRYWAALRYAAPAAAIAGLSFLRFWWRVGVENQGLCHSPNCSSSYSRHDRKQCN